MNRIFSFICLISIASGATAFAAAPGAPASPEVTANGDPNGLMKATIKVKAPATTVDGNTLDKVQKLEIYRNGNVVKTFDLISPGEEQTFDDVTTAYGYVEYTAAAFNATGKGELSVPQQVFIGVDVPLPPAELKAKVSNNRISFTWPKSAKTGENGERIRQDALTYTLDALDASYSYQSTLSETKGQTHDYFCDPHSGVQDIRRFGVRASNTAGWSEYRYTKVVFGAPYYLPFKESFAGAISHGLMWQEGDGDFMITSEDCVDGDSGALLCIPTFGEPTSFNLGKMCMTGTQNPRISFKVKGLGKNETIVIRVARADGAEATLHTITGPITEWETVTIDMSALKKEFYIIPKFLFGTNNKETVLLDDIRIEDPYTTDLGITVNAPETSYGETTIELKVTNEGLEASSEASIDLYTNGVSTERIYINDILQPGETKIYNAVVNVEGDESVEVKARLTWLFDVNPANDTASAQVIPVMKNNTGEAGIESINRKSTTSSIFTLDGKAIISTDISTLTSGTYIIDGRVTIVR